MVQIRTKISQKYNDTHNYQIKKKVINQKKGRKTIEEFLQPETKYLRYLM